MRKVVALLLIVILLTSCNAPSTNIGITSAWARPGLQGENSAIYFVIDNPTQEDDVLLSASSDAAQMVEVHQTLISADGTMSMAHQDSVLIPAGAQTIFEPGGFHVMLMGLTADLQAGDTLHFILTFENAGEISAEAEIRAP